MIQKWKTILTNWFNCYFDESERKERCITIDSVLNIISHLRENLSLDESKSSILEAHTVEEFIREKYPEFRFSNGGLEADTEEELYMVTSLLLLFVCVNSKDIDIKNAMCNKLSIEDQEVILKFSKCLMECSPIKYIDVLTAINEACGQETLMTEPDKAQGMASETPPALRSLHGEVRRLQAALDAERFDRNYLQEELSRTNLKLEKLLKDKEQYKTDIVNLKAKISMCCGQESDTKSTDMVTEGTTKLMKQIEQIEEKLVETQGQLEDVQHERDTYRIKVYELKQERDKLVSLHHQETTKNTQLSEYLENERRSVISLRELLNELRQHQQLNRLDSSLLECDDPDASMHSLQHNSSICSEACANVVEVQLGEEREKIVVLKQEIQSLQEQLYELSRKTETERLSLEKVVSEKDNDIFNLKHRINEEIEIKNNMTVHHNDKVSKLNNDINELEQKLKDNHLRSNLVIETKMKDIQTLQEEKLSLLQSFHDETTKLEKNIKNLKAELDNERTSKLKMKEEYEHQLMKMKEKVLNRNNELVELQNNVLKASEEIEHLHLVLRQEKQAKEEIMEQYHNELELVNTRRLEAENDLRQRCNDIETFKERLKNNNSHIDKLNAELEYLKESVSQLTETCNILEQNKTSLVDEIGIRNNKIEEQQKEVDNWRNKVSEERESSKKHIDEYEMRISILTKSIDDIREEMSKQKDSYTAVLDSRARDIQTLQQENQSLHNELNDVKLELDQKVHSLKEKLSDNENLTEKLKTSYESQIENLNLMVTKLTNFLKDKTIELESSKKEKDRLQEMIDSNSEVIHFLEDEVKSQKHNQEKLISEFESERLVLKNMITVTESVMEDQKVSMTQVLAEHDKVNESLKRDIEVLKQELIAERTDAEDKLHEKENALKHALQELSEVKNERDTEKKHNEKVNEGFNNEIVILKEEITTKSALIETLKLQNNDLAEMLQKCKDDLVTIEDTKQELIIDIEVLKEQNKTLLTEITILEKQNRDMNNVIVDSKNDANVIQENNNELKMKLDSQEKEYSNKLEKINKDFDKQVEINKQLEITLEEKHKCTVEMEEKVTTLNNQIEALTQVYNRLEQEKNEYKTKVDELKAVLDAVEGNLKEQIDKLKEENNKLTRCIEENKQVIHSLKEEVKSQKYNQENIIREFESEKLVLKNMVTVNESVIEDQKLSMTQVLAEHEKVNVSLKRDIEILKQELVAEKRDAKDKLHEKENALKQVLHELSDVKKERETERYNNEKVKEEFNNEIMILKKEISTKSDLIEALKLQNNDWVNVLQKCKDDATVIQENANELKIKLDSRESEFSNKSEKMNKDFNKQVEINKQLEITLKEKHKCIVEMEEKVMTLNNQIEALTQVYNRLEQEKNEYKTKVDELKAVLDAEEGNLKEQIAKLKEENTKLTRFIEENKQVINMLEEEVKYQKDNQEKLISEFESERLILKNMVTIKESVMEDQKVNMTQVLTQYQKVNESFKRDIEVLKQELVAEKRDAIDKLSKKENSLKEILAELSEVKKERETERNNNEKVKEEFNNEIVIFKEEITTKLALIETLKLQNNDLAELLQKCKDDLVMMEDSKHELFKDIELLKERNKTLLTEITDLEKQNRDLNNIIEDFKSNLVTMEDSKQELIKDIELLKEQNKTLLKDITVLEKQNRDMNNIIEDSKSNANVIEENNSELKIKLDSQEKEFSNKLEKINKDFNKQVEINKQLEITLEEKLKLTVEIEEKVTTLNNQVEVLTKAYNRLEEEKNEYKTKVEGLKMELHAEKEKVKEQITKSTEENDKLTRCIEENKQVIINLQEIIKKGKNETDFDKLNLDNKCSLLEEYQIKAEKQLEDREKEIKSLEEEIKTLTVNAEKHEENIKNKDYCIRDKDETIATIKQELADTKTAKEHLQIILDTKEAELSELKHRLDNVNSEEVIKALRNEEWVKAGLKEMHAVQGTNSHKYSGPHEKDYRDFHHQVDNTTSDLTYSSMDSIKTISDLEKIIHDKNRTITSLQSDITYLKSLIADSENKVLDVFKELELSKENAQQLSSQLKKIVYQKNEEIAELKKQVTKMSATENRASQIIKVSAKYQAIILKRIAEIKTNTVLKELTNFGNSTNGDNELRRSLNTGTITMDDLENFLETTDKHLRRCSEKQIALQKERDRLTEVNRINESEIINLKKFLTELSVSFKTFSNIKDVYTHKLSRVVSVQRTVRREILSLDGRINDATMCKLERGYAAVMQDLSEAVMNLERWVERSISRTISAEKIKQAFMSDEERTSLASTTFQNAGLEVQLGELENSFQKLLEEVVRAQKGEGVKDAEAITVMEVRAEYEDKLNRMKAKMKQLYQEQIAVYKEQQREEIASLERELLKAREKLAETSKSYDEHIRALTTELWRVGEKFLTKKEEADWLRRKQVTGSLMSLQHVHSSGLVAPQEEASRVSDGHSLRSLPVFNNGNKREGRGLHMSDEEGEVFDNRWLQQLAATPRRSPKQRSPGPRLSELRWRNSLCPPHLKSSYPAETQFAPALDEDDIKCTGAPSLGGRNQRKEVGITAYKKPGPPTPSKQAGRLSATDSELRESLRLEPEPQVSRKTSTPSRLRSLFRSNKNDTAEGTPRSKRLSIFRKK